MELMSTFKNRLVYIISNKKPNKGKTVMTKVISQSGFLDEALKSEITVSKAVIELRERFCIHIEYYQKSAENGGTEKSEISEITQKNDMETLKEFLKNYYDSNGQLPNEKLINSELDFSLQKIRRLKSKLQEDGFLYKENERVYKIADLEAKANV